MVKRPSPCDPNRLRSYLDDELSPHDQAELAGHLDHCGTCQKALERLAAGSRLWDDLRQLDGPIDPAMTGIPHGERPSRWSERPKSGGRERAELDFLTPTEDPAYLGRLGPYEVIGVLGEGGMGVVLKAFDPSLSRVVAIKVLAPQMAASGAARRRFFREAKAAAAVVHDHVVAIYAVDTDPRSSLPYLVMPCIAGHSLQERIDRDGPLRPEEVLRIGMQAALGLAAAHAQGLVHRDIKPSNILLENGVERVKITDFGLARAIDDASQSQSGVVAGTPQYMSPEQASGETSDHRADLFSLGSVLYAMCAGHSPFRAKTTMGVLRRVCDESPRPLVEINPDVPEALESVIERLHAKDPSKRYQSASEVAEVLGQQLAEFQRPGARHSRRAPATAPQPVTNVTPAPNKAEPVDWAATRPRPHFGRLAAAALVVMLGLAVVATAAWYGSPTAPSPHYALVEPDGPGGTVVAVGTGAQPANVIVTNSGEPSMIVGSGKPATKTWNIADFTGVEIAHSFRAEVTRADQFAVSVTADDNVLGHVMVAKEGTRLRISLEDNQSYRIRRDSLKVAITMPALESLALTHGTRAAIRGFESRRPFEAKLLHGSLLEGKIGVGPITIDAMHGSEVILNGTAETAKLVSMHGSRLLLEGLVIRDAVIHLMHGSKGTINARSESAFKAEVQHGSILNGMVQARTLELTAEHGARVSLNGSATSAKLTGEHASRFSLGELVLENADVRLDFGSSAIVNAKGQLKHAVGHSASLRYLGSPKLEGTISRHGGSVRAASAEDARPAERNQPANSPSTRSRGKDDDIITIRLSNNRIIGSGAMIEGSGKRVTKEVDIKDFTTIRIARLIRAEVTRAPSFKVTLTADDNILESIEAVREGSTLRIGLAEGNYHLAERPHVSITLPTLEELDVAGAAHATIQGFESDRPFRARASGASTLDGSIKAGDVEFDASGASTLKLAGSSHGAQLLASGASKLELANFDLKAEKVIVDLSGASSASVRGSARVAVLKAEAASRLQLPDLTLEAVDIALSGASNATCRVTSLLNYELSSASRLEYFGGPTIGKAERTGASSISHR